jgi:hypothetical protein
MAVFRVVETYSLMMKAASPSESLVNFYQIPRHNDPEGSRLHTRRRENLKFNIFISLCFLSKS